MDLSLILARRWFESRATIGELYVDGAYQCLTLEDVVRAPGVKVFGKTAIPAGLYRVKLDFSPKFSPKRFAYMDNYLPEKFQQKGWKGSQDVLIPHLLGVPGFDQVRIHWGNDEDDTEGCILTGTTKDLQAQTVGASRDAFEGLMDHLEPAAHAGYNIAIEISQHELPEKVAA